MADNNLNSIVEVDIYDMITDPKYHLIKKFVDDTNVNLLRTALKIKNERVWEGCCGSRKGIPAKFSVFRKGKWAIQEPDERKWVMKKLVERTWGHYHPTNNLKIVALGSQFDLLETESRTQNFTSVLIFLKRNKNWEKDDELVKNVERNWWEWMKKWMNPMKCVFIETKLG